jgi:predicted acyltransferase
MMNLMPGNIAQASAPTNRVLSIDVLRGLTIALMILVNDPGDWAYTYSQLDHAKWNGFTVTDLVFPNFLFIVGASIILSLQARIRRSPSGKLDNVTRQDLAIHIFRRSAIIFGLDLFFGLYPHFHYTHLRLYGVLTRIAICYLCAGLICVITQRARTLLAIVAALLIGYWVIMRFVPVPGCGVPTHDIPLLDPDCNLAAWLDRNIIDFFQKTLHTGRLYEHTRDPEGFLSTFPAIATTLIGSVAAIWVCRTETRNTQRISSSITNTIGLNGLLLSSVLCLAAGSLWNLCFPINKNLWTSSYVLSSAGWALLILAVLYWLIDIRRLNETSIGKWFTFPWLVFGSNAIVAFCISVFLVENMLWIKISSELGPNGHPVTAWFWIYHHIFAFNCSTKNTSLAFALAFVAICFIPNWLLWRKRKFIKI